MSTLEEIKTAVAALPTEQQIELNSFLCSLRRNDDEQRAVVRRRVAEIRANPAATIPGEDVFAEMERLLGK